jgi:fucose permease
MQAVSWLTLTGALVLGMVLALLGSIKLALAKRLHLDEARVDGLAAALNAALIPAAVFAGILIDVWSVKWVFILGCVLAASGVYGLAQSSSFGRAIVSTFVLGVGAAHLGVAALVLMPEAFFGLEEKVAASLNLGTFFWAMGALLMPGLVELLLRFLDLRKTLIVLAGVVLLPAVIALGVHGSEFVYKGDGASAAVLQQSRLWLAGLVLALYLPVEFCLSTWGRNYLIEVGHRDRRAAWLLAGFWCAFAVGRLVMASLDDTDALPPGLERWLILFLALGVAVAMGNLIGSADRRPTAWGFLALGLLLGPIFPSLVGLVFEGVNQGQWGSACGILVALGSLGSFVLAPVLSAQARRRTVRRALRMPLFLTLLLAGAVLVLAVW